MHTCGVPTALTAWMRRRSNKCVRYDLTRPWTASETFVFCKCNRSATYSSLKVFFRSDNLKKLWVIKAMEMAKAESAKNMKIRTKTRSGKFTGVTSAGIVRMTPSVQ